MAVTVPGANGSIVTISPGTGDVLGLAQQIGNYLNGFVNNGLQLTTDSTGGSIPTPPGGSGPTQLNIDSSTPLTGTVPTGWQYIYDYGTGPDDLSVANAALLTGTVGGSWNLSGNSTIAATGGNNTVSATGNYLMSFGPGNNVVYALGTGAITDDSGGSSMLYAVAGSNTINSAGSGDFVAALAPVSTNSTGADFGLLGAGGAILATLTGANDTISTGLSNASISSSGNDAVVFGGSAASSISVSGLADTVVGGAGSMTVDAASGVQLFGASGPISFVGGAALSVILGGTGGSENIAVGGGGILFATGADNTSTIVGGTSPGIATIFGGTGSSVFFNETMTDGGSGAYLLAGAGNETLDGAASNTDETLGGSYAGNASLVGGSGDNTFFAGSDATTMTGGSSSNTFALFANDMAPNAQFTITNFSATDNLDLLGFSSTTSLSTILSDATTGPAGLTITLSDNVSVTFTNLTNTQALENKTLYT